MQVHNAVLHLQTQTLVTIICMLSEVHHLDILTGICAPMPFNAMPDLEAASDGFAVAPNGSRLCSLKACSTCLYSSAA